MYSSKLLATSQPGAVAVGARLTKGRGSAAIDLDQSGVRSGRLGLGAQAKDHVADRAPAQRCRDKQISPIAGPGLAAVSASGLP